MRTNLLKIAVFAVLLVLVSAAVVVVNQTAGLVELAGRLHPVVGQVVLWTLLLVYAACIVVPVALLLRLPRALRPPGSEEDPAFPAYLERLGARLRRNPRLAGRRLESREDIEEALQVLGGDAEAVITGAANRVFISTAVSQNGALDTLFVFGVQSKLVWDVAHVYWQRPTLRDMAWLYGNVAATAFFAGQIEDADLSEQVQPLVSSVLGSAAGAVPGLQAVSTVFVTSVMSGAANAFLTLRVGIIARDSCGSLLRPERRSLRRTAFVRAASMLTAIVVDGARKLSSALVKASGRKVGDTVSGLGVRVRNAGGRIVDRFSSGRQKGSEGA